MVVTHLLQRTFTAVAVYKIIKLLKVRYLPNLRYAGSVAAPSHCLLYHPKIYMTTHPFVFYIYFSTLLLLQFLLRLLLTLSTMLSILVLLYLHFILSRMYTHHFPLLFFSTGMIAIVGGALTLALCF